MQESNPDEPTNETRPLNSFWRAQVEALFHQTHFEAQSVRALPGDSVSSGQQRLGERRAMTDRRREMHGEGPPQEPTAGPERRIQERRNGLDRRLRF